MWLPSSKPSAQAACKSCEEWLLNRCPLQKRVAVALQSGLLSLYCAKTARIFSSVFDGASSNVIERSLRVVSTYETPISDTSQYTSSLDGSALSGSGGLGVGGVGSGMGVGVGSPSIGVFENSSEEDSSLEEVSCWRGAMRQEVSKNKKGKRDKKSFFIEK